MQQITYNQIKKFCFDDPIRPMLREPYLIDGRWYASDGHFIISIPEANVKYCEDFENNKLEGTYPNVKAYLQEANIKADKTVNLGLIDAAFSKLPMTDEMVEKEVPINYIKCPCCNGNGNININHSVYFKNRWVDTDVDVECPVCHCYGEIPDWEDYDPEDDEEDYDPVLDTTFVKRVKTGNKVHDYEKGVIFCEGLCFNAILLKRIVDFFYSVGANIVNYEVKQRESAIIFEYEDIYIYLLGCLRGDRDVVVAW